LKLSSTTTTRKRREVKLVERRQKKKKERMEIFKAPTNGRLWARRVKTKKKKTPRNSKGTKTTTNRDISSKGPYDHCERTSIQSGAESAVMGSRC